MSRLFLQSLSLRLLAIFLLFGALFAFGMLQTVRCVYRADDLRSLISGHLALHVDYVRRDIGNPPDTDRALAITKRVPVDIRISGPGVEWASHPEFPALSMLTFGASRYFSEEPDAWLNELEEVEFAELDNHRYMRLVQGPYSIIVSTTRIEDEKRAPPLLSIAIGMGLLLVLLTYLAVRWLFMPIREIREGAARIGRGEFDHRIERVRHDELGDLARDVNTLAAAVQGMLDAKRQLLLGISHELRTPLSRLKLGLELLDDKPAASAMSTDVDEMERVIATLIEAERLNSRHAILNRSMVDPAGLAAQVIRNFFGRDAERIRLNVVGDPPDVQLDEARIVLLLKNLLSNALRYTHEDAGPVTLTVESNSGMLTYAVSDHGPGIAPENVAHLGEPFWRGDPSRTRGTGGSGLGLYLAKLVSIAHGGRLELDTAYTGGARFVVHLPA